jgi:hypothetical protein
MGILKTIYRTIMAIPTAIAAERLMMTEEYEKLLALLGATLSVMEFVADAAVAVHSFPHA